MYSNRSPLLLGTFFFKYMVADWLVIITSASISFGIRSITTHQQFVSPQYDAQLDFPHRSSTVSTEVLTVLAAIIPLVVLIAHCLLFYRQKINALLELNVAILGLFSSLAFTDLLTTIFKKYVGRPRPNFYALCSCTKSAIGISCPFSECPNESFESFPSGHASIAFAGLAFLSFFLAFHLLSFRFRNSDSQAAAVGASASPLESSNHNQLWKICICLIPSIVALWIASTRSVDYWHNIDDIAAGSLLGSFFAYLSARVYGSMIIKLNEERESFKLGENQMVPIDTPELLSSI